jgi:hypothetical protein
VPIQQQHHGTHIHATDGDGLLDAIPQHFRDMERSRPLEQRRTSGGATAKGSTRRPEAQWLIKT